MLDTNHSAIKTPAPRALPPVLPLLAVLALLAVAAAGCAPPRILVAQGFAGERVIRYNIQEVAQNGKDDEKLFNLGARICTQGDDGDDLDCKDSLLLENVKPRSIY